MKRHLFSFPLALGACSAIAAPGPAFAQASPPAEVAPAIVQAPPPSAPTLAPVPTVEPTQPVAAPATAPPPPSAEPAPPAPELAPPTKVAPVIVAEQQKGNVAGQAGVLAVGVAAGAGGAAVAGPVGKFAGAFVGKTIARTIFGVDKPKTPNLTVVQPDPSIHLVEAQSAGADAPAAAPPATQVADDS